jgi:hypothetical protein
LTANGANAAIGQANLRFDSTNSILTLNGGLILCNGYRPLYSNVTGTSLTTLSTSYGTHYSITNSGFNALTLATSVYSTDANAYWVFRNNTGTYMNISVTYTGTGGGGFAAIVIPPANSTTIMFISGTSGSNAYAFF